MLVINEVAVVISSTTIPPEDLHIKVDKDQIVWSSRIGDVLVVFGSETPFTDAVFNVPADASVASGLPNVVSCRHGYKYSIFKDNKLLFDPKVFIDK
jgi:hypothetical protein